MDNLNNTALYKSSNLDRQIKSALLRCSCTWPGLKLRGHLERALWYIPTAQHLDGVHNGQKADFFSRNWQFLSLCPLHYCSLMGAALVNS